MIKYSFVLVNLIHAFYIYQRLLIPFQIIAYTLIFLTLITAVDSSSRFQQQTEINNHLESLKDHRSALSLIYFSVFNLYNIHFLFARYQFLNPPPLSLNFRHMRLKKAEKERGHSRTVKFLKCETIS